jgi:uncharacterized protein YneF (UPF0154 family)
MKEALCIVVIALSLVLGGIVGYVIGTYHVKREAIANNQAHYEYVMNGMGDMGREFAWGGEIR